jgi:hypothetical protein
LNINESRMIYVHYFARCIQTHIYTVKPPRGSRNRLLMGMLMLILTVVVGHSAATIYRLVREVRDVAM